MGIRGEAPTATGESNTGSNVGTGVGVYKGMSATVLELRRILAGTDITVNLVGDDIVIALDSHTHTESEITDLQSYTLPADLLVKVNLNSQIAYKDEANVFTENLSLSATKKLHFDNFGDSYDYESSANILRRVAGGNDQIVCGYNGSTNFTRVSFMSKVGLLTVSEVTAGFSMVGKNTTDGKVYLYANDGGTIKKVELT